MGRQPAGPPGLSEQLIERAHAWAEQSALDQRLPMKIADAATIGQVVSLLGATREVGSDPPDWCQPCGVEAVVAAPGRPDDDVIEHGCDDRPLPAERKIGPPLPQGRGVADMAVEHGDAA